MFQNGESVSYGLVVRDVSGNFICAKADKLAPFISIAEAEALSVREALSWLKFRGDSQVIVEFDSLILFEALTDFDGGFSYFHSIIEDCKALARSFCSNVLSLISGNENIVVHNIARSVFLMRQQGFGCHHHLFVLLISFKFNQNPIFF